MSTSGLNFLGSISSEVCFGENVESLLGDTLPLEGIPEQAVAPIVAQAPVGGQAVALVVAQAPAGGQAVNPPSQPQAPQTTVPHGGPNANPLNLSHGDFQICVQMQFRFTCFLSLLFVLLETLKTRIKFAIQYMRRSILKKAKFDIEELNTIKVAKSSFVPVLFGHAIDDDFIQPHHSDRIFNAYVGDKNIIKFDGDHNSPRPQFYFDSVNIFFHNVLQPPEDERWNLRCLEKMTNEKLLHLHEVASRNNDVQLADFVESEFLTEQVKAIKKMFEYVAQLRRVGKGHGV
ncbi:hypothetical protein POM88_026992 [Heracleum sosnowskyi]|uniref:Ferritin/DPS domain-containing protein n=1 Tax=Heracleum sosnowskyi TaxID=360622 RepID=A0AAD8I9A4_9APIA|nr:hypothetical protein POM88_026992 [Heracleum sosnowskyi]